MTDSKRRFPRVSRSLARARRASRKPPRVLARRVADELRAEADRFRAPSLGRRFDNRALLAATGSTSVDELWLTLAGRPWPFTRGAQDAAAYERAYPGDRERIEAAADAAAARRVDLLGSGPLELGTPVDWHLDYLSGRRWPLAYARRLEYAELGSPTDVKLPWEISRLQWLVPCGQSYLLTGNEERAHVARDVIDEWIDANPYALGVNWACTMDVALRLITLTWLFHALAHSEAWSETAWRARLLRSIYLHGLFTERNLERSDVNGNHYTADLVGLLAAALFFGDGRDARRWAVFAWGELVREIELQVYPDGVDFEASAAYHRLVGELFLLGALFRRAGGGDAPTRYRERLLAMSTFVRAYTRPDGTAPNWGDADDARALPLGGQPVSDHRHFAAAVAAMCAEGDPGIDAGDGHAELWWLLGRPAESGTATRPPQRSSAFPDGGAYVLRGGTDHVFADCGPVGLAGRGGHGHNDCLSFEAYLDGIPLIVDCGAYTYTRSVEWRNRFRSTASHNTPLVDGEEQNRIDPQSLWSLADDAAPEVTAWETRGAVTLLRGTHRGYERLARPVRVTRTLALDSDRHVLAVLDELTGAGVHEVTVPFHLAPGVRVVKAEKRAFELGCDGRRFVLAWHGDWQPSTSTGWYSPSYGVKHEIGRVELRRSGDLADLLTVLAPGTVSDAGDLLAHARTLVGR